MVVGNNNWGNMMAGISVMDWDWVCVFNDW
jgi:hypothetical protein